MRRIGRHLVQKHHLAQGTPEYRRFATAGIRVCVLPAKRAQLKLQPTANAARPDVVLATEPAFCNPSFDGLYAYYDRHIRQLEGDTAPEEGIKPAASGEDQPKKNRLYFLRGALVQVRKHSSCTSCSNLCGSVLRDANVLDAWFSESMRNRKGGTVRTYKSALKDYLAYVMGFHIQDYAYLEVYLRGRMAQLDSYNQVLKKKVQRETFERFSQDEPFLLTLDDIRQLENSQYIADMTRDILSLDRATFLKHAAVKDTESDESTEEQWPPCTPPVLKSSTDATSARDVLITLLFFRSLQRTGTFIGMTTANFASAQAVDTKRGPIYVISVADHKTFDSCGPARLAVEPRLYDAMSNYMRYLRPLCLPEGKDDNNKFFVTRDGSALSSGVVSNGIRCVGERSGLSTDLTTITNLRKSIVTILYLQRPEERVAVAQQMTHRPSTGKRGKRRGEKS